MDVRFTKTLECKCPNCGLIFEDEFDIEADIEPCMW